MTTDHAPDLDVTHARQARRGRHALMILAWSLGLGLIALAVVWAVYSTSLRPLRGNREAPPQVAQAAATGGPIASASPGG
jgi:hypothetical protein